MLKLFMTNLQNKLMKDAISQWNKNSTAIGLDEVVMPDNLCSLYMPDSSLYCKVCPIAEMVGSDDCASCTPFRNVFESYNNGNFVEFVKSTKAEVKFLSSLCENII